MNVGTSPVPQRIAHNVLFGSTKCRLMFTAWKDIDNKGIPSQESQRYSPCNPGLASTIYDNLTIRWLNMKSVNPERAREGICESANSLSNPKWNQTLLRTTRPWNAEKSAVISVDATWCQQTSNVSNYLWKFMFILLHFISIIFPQHSTSRQYWSGPPPTFWTSFWSVPTPAVEMA